jgi:hypothetical protein
MCQLPLLSPRPERCLAVADGVRPVGDVAGVSCRSGSENLVSNVLRLPSRWKSRGAAGPGDGPSGRAWYLYRITCAPARLRRSTEPRKSARARLYGPGSS